MRYGVVASLALALSWPAAARTQSAVDPNHGVIEVTRQLRSLGSVKRVLVIGAHPDDEDTSLLTLLERGMGADAAYLSLNRGEGGQNLIGRELGDGLGLVRTEELLAARRLDGAEQFFTRAYDFGYSKSADETFTFWPRDSLLADVVSVVRRFRPQVIVSIFSGTRRDGHGQHRAAGLLAREAFEIAGDPGRFPEQLAAGLEPWSPLKLYRSTRFDQGATTLRMETGSLDPLYGRSYHQIAMASRSQHRSQDMGRIEGLGPRETRMQFLESRLASSAPREETSIFDGVDTTLIGMVGAIEEAAARSALADVLENYLELLEGARAALTQWQPGRAAPQLAEALVAVRRGRELAEDAGHQGRELSFVLDVQEEKLQKALLAAAGVVIDAFADDDLVVPGQMVKVEAEIWNGGATDIELREVSLLTPFGTRTGTIASRAILSAGSLTKSEFEVPIPGDAALTVPYYLSEPRQGAVYDWPADPSVRGLPFGPPLITARVALDIERVPVEASVEAVYRFADQASGEVRRPLRVVPAVSVEVAPSAGVWPLDRGGPSVFTVTAARSGLRQVSRVLGGGARGTRGGSSHVHGDGGYRRWPPLPEWVLDSRLPAYSATAVVQGSQREYPSLRSRPPGYAAARRIRPRRGRRSAGGHAGHGDRG
jgi:LmbE family N-acetylglucosaminyl deacetylase